MTVNQKHQMEKMIKDKEMKSYFRLQINELVNFQRNIHNNILKLYWYR